MKAQLRTYFQQFKKHTETGSTGFKNGKYWVSSRVPCFDFNKEIVIPGVSETYPEGAVGIRTDDNFFAVAVIPYEYRDTSVQDIVEVLFSDRYEEEDVSKFSYNPDVIVARQIG